MAGDFGRRARGGNGEVGRSERVRSLVTLAAPGDRADRVGNFVSVLGRLLWKEAVFETGFYEKEAEQCFLNAYEGAQTQAAKPARLAGSDDRILTTG